MTAFSAARSPATQGLRRGTPGYALAVGSLMLAGLASFNSLYTTQALMPALTGDLGVRPATAALTVSAATGALALAIVPASVLSERFGRGRVIAISSLAAALVGLATPFAPTIGVLIVLRALQGLLLAGVPATAMAWLSEEIDPEFLPRAMGHYVAGTTIGGLSSRLIPSLALEFTSWRWALGSTALFGVTCAVVMILLMPAQRRFFPKRLTFEGETRAIIGHWTNPRLVMLFAVAFTAMGAFVSLYNFLGYRLTSPPFNLGSAQVGFVFLLYLFGTLASMVTGRIVHHLGRGRTLVLGALLCVLGLPLVLVGEIVTTLAGVAVFTFGFFVAHSTSSGWVGALATVHRAEATGTYLLCYYLGSSVLGYASGLVLGHWGWTGLVVWLLGLVVVCVALGIAVTRADRLATASQVAQFDETPH